MPIPRTTKETLQLIESPIIEWVDDDLRVRASDQGPEYFFGLSKKKYSIHDGQRCYGMKGFTIAINPGDTHFEIYSKSGLCHTGQGMEVWYLNRADGFIYLDFYGRCGFNPSGKLYRIDRSGFGLAPFGLPR